MDLHIDFLGLKPAQNNRAAPEVNPAVRIAVAAARRALEDAGYDIARAGHGSYRLREGGQ